jgi:hypothetical protein
MDHYRARDRCRDLSGVPLAQAGGAVKINLAHWMGEVALQKTGLQGGDQEFTAEQIVALHDRFDVMLTTSARGSDVPILWLDDKGKRFRGR